MSSTFKKELKKPDWKTLKFPGEEKKQEGNYFMHGPQIAEGARQSERVDRISRGVQKRDLRKCT